MSKVEEAIRAVDRAASVHVAPYQWVRTDVGLPRLGQWVLGYYAAANAALRIVQLTQEGDKVAWVRLSDAIGQHGVRVADVELHETTGPSHWMIVEPPPATPGPTLEDHDRQVAGS